MTKKIPLFLKKHRFSSLAYLFWFFCLVRLKWPSNHYLYKYTTILDGLVFIISIIIMVYQLPFKSNDPHNYIGSRALCTIILIVSPIACLWAKYTYNIDNCYISEYLNIIAAYLGISSSFLSLYNSQPKDEKSS